MATYPALLVDVKGSTQQPLDALQVDQWPDGSSRGMALVTPGRFMWDLVHGNTADVDAATLEAFYDVNRRLGFDFLSPWDGITYSGVRFAAAPVYKRLPGLFWQIKVKLRQA